MQIVSIRLPPRLAPILTRLLLIATLTLAATGCAGIRIVYDVPRGRVEMTASQGGRVVEQVAGPIRKTDLGPGRRPLRIDFSQRKVVDNAFYPLWGSRFSDLVVRLEP